MRDSKRAERHYTVIDGFISPASIMKLRVPVRGRAKNKYPETEGWVFVCAAHPFLSYPLATPTLPLHRIALNKSTQVRKGRPKTPKTLRFTPLVPYPVTCARRRLPLHHRPTTPVVAHLLPVARIQPQIHEGLLYPQRIVAPECGHHFIHITGNRTRTPVAERPVRSAPTRSTACRDYTYSHSPQTQA